MVNESQQAVNELPLGVSFVVFTFNSRKLIEDALVSVLAQKDAQHPIEILLVDNNSTDDTVAFVTEFLDTSGVDFRVLKQEKPGLFHSRVAGIAAAKYRYFVFVDDDNRLVGQWADAVCYLLESKASVGLIAAVNEARLGGEQPTWWESQKHSYAVGRPNEESGPVAGAFSAAWGAGLSGRTLLVRKLYEHVKFWLVGRTGSILLAGEDSELSYWARLSGYTIYQSELRLIHFIEARKLDEAYLLGLHKGFRIADTYLLQYRMVLTGVTPFWHRLNYAWWLWSKWLVAPLRKAFAEGEVERLDIITKKPTLGECFSFLFAWGKWSKVTREIKRTRKALKTIIAPPKAS